MGDFEDWELPTFLYLQVLWQPWPIRRNIRDVSLELHTACQRCRPDGPKLCVLITANSTTWRESSSITKPLFPIISQLFTWHTPSSHLSLSQRILVSPSWRTPTLRKEDCMLGWLIASSQRLSCCCVFVFDSLKSFITHFRLHYKLSEPWKRQNGLRMNEIRSGDWSPQQLRIGQLRLKRQGSYNFSASLQPLVLPALDARFSTLCLGAWPRSYAKLKPWILLGSNSTPSCQHWGNWSKVSCPYIFTRKFFRLCCISANGKKDYYRANVCSRSEKETIHQLSLPERLREDLGPTVLREYFLTSQETSRHTIDLPSSRSKGLFYITIRFPISQPLSV